MPAKVDVPPPPAPVRSGGGGSEWVELIRARDDIDAHLLAGLLEEAGIESRSLKDRSVPVWMYGGSNPWAPVIILVRRLHLEDARIVLAEVSWNAPPATTPPAQRNTRPRRAPALWWLVALVLGAFVVATLLFELGRATAACGSPVSCLEAGTRIVAPGESDD